MSIKDVYEYVQGEYQDLSKIEQDIAGIANVPFVYRGISISGYNINLYDDAIGTTQLVLDTDYSLLFRDNTISDNESENVFAGYTVINVAYQSVKLYLDIRCIGGYTKFTGGTYEEISTPQTITPPSFGHTVYVDTSGGDIALTINDAVLNNDTITIVSKGANDTTLTMTGIAGGIIPGGEARTFLWVGASWYLVSDGVDGISIVWQGSLASAPGTPELNWGYYDTVLLKSFIWDGDSWEILSQDGTNGVDGVTIIWQGSLASAPGSPVAYWAYYNTTDKKSYIYNGSSWDILAQDGAKGDQGDPGVDGEFLPVGTILMFDGSGWSDNSTMTGWYACIAANTGQGCPDLENQFIKGSAPADVLNTGGSATQSLSIANLPSHDHTGASHRHTSDIHNHAMPHTHGIDHNHAAASTGAHVHDLNGMRSPGGSGTHVGPDVDGDGSLKAFNSLSKTPSINLPNYDGVSQGVNTASTSNTTPDPTGYTTPGAGGNTGSGTSHNNEPQYYKLIYIRKCA